jgi:hypothetical protein
MSCPWTQNLSRDVPADARYLCDKVSLLSDTINGTVCSNWLNLLSILSGLSAITNKGFYTSLVVPGEYEDSDIK